jgi:hypothetical protein
MNRRGFLSFSLLAPVAGVMAARDAMAAPAVSRAAMYAELVPCRAGESFIGERVWEPLTEPEQIRFGRNMKRILEDKDEIFGADDISNRSLKSWSRPAADESVSAQFDSDLAFLRDEPGVAI